MKYRMLCLCIFWMICLHAQSSEKIAVEGRVFDRETQQNLRDANIEALQTSIGAASDSDGQFCIFLPSGSYRISFSMMGYQTYETAVEIGANNVRLNIAMIPTVYLMQGVTLIQSAVREEEASVSTASVRSESVVRMPGSLNDIYRSVKTLPGVASNNGMGSEFYVRGGTFDENLVIVNNAQVYRPFHIKEAPNGSVAIFNMDLLKQVDLITGGFTARYGDKMSSVMNIQYREGNQDRFQWQVTGSMMHAGLMAEGPSYRGSWILGVRKSYLQYIIGLLGEDEAVNVDFYDVQGQVFCNPSPGKRLAFQFIHSGDDYRFGPKRQHQISAYEREWFTAESESHSNTHNKANYYNNLFALSFTNAINSRLLFKTVLSHYAEYENEREHDEDEWSQYIWDKYYKRPYDFYSNGLFEANRELKIYTTEAQQEATTMVNAFHELLAGFSYQHLKYDYTNKMDESYRWGNSYDAYPDTLNYSYDNNEFEDIHPSSYKLAGYLEDNWQIYPQIYANLGLRFDYFEFNRDFDVSPRINLSYITGFGPVIRAAWGTYPQSPSYRELRHAYATSGNTQAQRSIHHILSFETPLNAFWKIKVEGYYKKMDHLISFENQNGRYTYSQSNDSRGFASGLDVFLNWTYPRLSGWLSYGYLVAREDSLGDDKDYIPRITDQRHTLSLVTDFDLGKNWELRIKALYGSGFPYTPTMFMLVDKDKNIWEEVVGERNSARLPAYQRLDIRIGKTFQWKKVRMESYLELINALDRDNVFAYDWNWNDGHWERDVITLLPMIPNFGFVLKF